MSELFWMVNIINRNQSKRFKDFYKESGISVMFETVGAGTAVSEMLDYFGLEASEKLILFSVVSGEQWTKIKKGLQNRLKIDIPGTGIAFIIPMSSIGGKKALLFFTDGQNFQKGEETVLKNTENELLVVILNQGYSHIVMDAARSANASGGTVIHAKGTGMQQAEQFLGVSLVAEKEIIFLVAKRKDKNRIMRAIMDQAGLESKARSIVFSLPVTSTAGMRLLEYDES
ncbi:MAG: P-II family nitrogen regulator [bacterium]|nr:P-II family nitrogen regulator [bacterium]